VYTVGTSESFGAGGNDLVLVKWNGTTGAQLWNRTWGGPNYDLGWGIVGDTASGIYTSGYTASFGEGDYDLVVVKWDAATGTRLWNQTWGGSLDDYGFNIWGDAAGGLYTSGYTASFGVGYYDLVLVKWDAMTGTRLWNQTWGGSANDYGHGIWGNSAGEVFMVGTTESFGAGGYDVVLVKWGIKTSLSSPIQGFRLIFSQGSILIIVFVLLFKRRNSIEALS
jgi:hypothetical protein